MKPINNSDVAKALGLLMRSGLVKESDVIESLKRVCHGHEAAVDAAFEVGLFYSDSRGRFFSAHKFIDDVERYGASPSDLRRLPFAQWYACKYDV